MVSRLFILSLTAFILFFNTAMAQQAKPLIKITKTPVFDLPIDCIIGEDCWVMNYVDMGPDDEKQTDPACQARTYDGHKGTDFMILDEATMKKGVNVIAPLDGTIKKVRDGEEDRFPTEEQLEETKEQRKECGNAVLIDHGDGLNTIYCHLKKNSIKVTSGQTIKKDDVIGQVGLSGLTQFPHLHFGIIRDNEVIDPFTGQNNKQTCGTKKRSLWLDQETLQYQPFVIQNMGFDNNLPSLTDIEKDGKSAETITINSDLLTMWVMLFGVQENDTIHLTITDPNGKIFAERTIIQDKKRARQFYYTGRRTTKTPLIEGAYTGSVTIEREHKGQIIKDDQLTSILVIQN